MVVLITINKLNLRTAKLSAHTQPYRFKRLTNEPYDRHDRSKKKRYFLFVSFLFFRMLLRVGFFGLRHLFGWRAYCGGRARASSLMMRCCRAAFKRNALCNNDWWVYAWKHDQLRPVRQNKKQETQHAYTTLLYVFSSSDSVLFLSYILISIYFFCFSSSSPVCCFSSLEILWAFFSPLFFVAPFM